MQTFLDCIDAVRGGNSIIFVFPFYENLQKQKKPTSYKFQGSTGGTGFSAIKITALGRPEILVSNEMNSFHVASPSIFTLFVAIFIFSFKIIADVYVDVVDSSL